MNFLLTESDHLTLKIASAQIVKTSVTTSSPSQDSNHPHVIIFNQGMLLLGSNKFLKRQRSRMMALFKSMACSIQETNYGEKNDKIYGKLQKWTLLYILQRKMIKSHSHQSFAVSRKLKCVM